MRLRGPRHDLLGAGSSIGTSPTTARSAPSLRAPRRILNRRTLGPYCPPVQRLVFVTGKGGVGKTTVAGALAQRLAQRGRRVLAVDMAGDQRLAAQLGASALTTEPARIAGSLDGVRVDSRALVESYFRRLLRVPFLSRRLFASGTFQAVTAAAPGVSEFVVLEHLAHWTALGRFGRRAAYDTVIVDGPASGHALRLVRTPRQLAALVPRGPLSGTVGELDRLLADGDHTAILLVALPEELAVNETLETRAALAELGIRLLRPVLNRVWPRRFTAADAAAIAALRQRRDEPLLAAAGLQLAARHEAEQHLGRLRRAFGMAPVPLREACRGGVDRRVLGEMGRALQRGLAGNAA